MNAFLRTVIPLLCAGGLWLSVGGSVIAQPSQGTPRKASDDSTNVPNVTTLSMSANAGANYPDPDEFIDATEPTCDMTALQRRVEYPERARRKDIEGKVMVRVLVDPAGNPVKSFIDYTDHDLLSEAAQRAVMETRFTPGLQNGKPVAVWVSVPVIFKLK